MSRWRQLLQRLSLREDPGSRHLEGRVIACARPRRLASLADRDIRLLINLTSRAHDDARLGDLGIVQLHLPMRDFAAPTPRQLRAGVAAVRGQLSDSGCVLIHCGGGYGRTGTLLACVYVATGLSPAAAIARVRHERPGSIETRGQLQAIGIFAANFQ